MSRSRIEHKNVVFEKLFFYIAPLFWCFWAGFFCKIAAFENCKNIQVFGGFLWFEEQSREKGACSRACYLFIPPLCGSDSFCTKNTHTLRQDCVWWHKNAKNIWFCSSWVEWAKTLGFLHIQLNSCKTICFLHCYATGRSPSNHRWLNWVLKIVDSHREYLILSTRLLCQSWGIGKSVFYHMRKISQKLAQRNWFILLSFGILIDFFQKLIVYTAPVKKFFILL